MASREQTTKIRNSVAELNGQGLSIGEIAKMVGTTEGLVSYYLRSMGLKCNTKSVTKSQIEKIKELALTGITCREIAEIVGCSVSTAHRYSDKNAETREEEKVKDCVFADHTKDKEIKRYFDKRTKKQYFDITNCYLHQSEV